MKTFVIAGCRCGSNTLHKTLVNNGFTSRRGHNPHHYKMLYKDKNFFEYIDDDDEEITIIDVYRTPIERKLSMFFKKLENNSDKLNDKGVAYFNRAFCRDFLYADGYDHFSEAVILRYNLIIPDFDFEKGYIKIKKGKITYVKLLFSDIKRWGDILSEVFGKKIRIYEDNISTYSKYLETKKCLVITNPIYNFIRTDPIMKKNMTEEDRENYLNFWRERMIK